MKDRISSIIPLFLITILSVVGVEALYQALEFFLFKPSSVSEQGEKIVTTPPPGTPQKTPGQKPDYSIILKRDLFSRPESETAQESQIEAEEEAPLKASELDIVLMGTISGSDNSKRAIILNKKTREQEIYSTGEVIEGNLIKEIQRGKLILSSNGNDEILDMSEAAQMRPAYKPPKKTAANSSSRSENQIGGSSSPDVRSAPVPRRRVVRRPRARGNAPRPPEQ